jgi:ElaB/YqjD/DUF883 family membrane-anchored ribosome-binding protein
MTDNDRSTADSGDDGTGIVQDLRQRAIDAYDATRESASGATRRAGDTIGEAPLIALGAGVAIGAVLAALIPTSRRERDLLRPYGNRVTDAAREAADAAKRTGSEKLRELGLTPDSMVDKASEAARATAQAAVSSLKTEGAKR